jgi:hypothetical protein
MIRKCSARGLMWTRNPCGTAGIIYPRVPFIFLFFQLKTRFLFNYIFSVLAIIIRLSIFKSEHLFGCLVSYRVRSIDKLSFRLCLLFSLIRYFVFWFINIKPCRFKKQQLIILLCLMVKCNLFFFWFNFRRFIVDKCALSERTRWFSFAIGGIRLVFLGSSFSCRLAIMEKRVERRIDPPEERALYRNSRWCGSPYSAAASSLSSIHTHTHTHTYTWGFSKLI